MTIGICDWCETEQEVIIALDKIRLLCPEQIECLARMPMSRKSQTVPNKNYYICKEGTCLNFVKIKNGSCHECLMKFRIDVDKFQLMFDAAYPHGTERRYRKDCKCNKCLWAHSEKVQRDKEFSKNRHPGVKEAAKLRHLPEAHAIEDFLEKCKNPHYIPTSATLLAVQAYLQKFISKE